MNKRILLGVVTLALITSPVNASSEAVSACDADTVVERLRQKLSELQAYRLETQVQVDESSIKTKIAGKQPDRLKLTMIPDNRSDRMTKAVFDGTHQWVQQGEGSEARALKVNLKKTTSDQRPFDTGYYLMGTGLLNGEDFPSTIQKLTSLYNLEAECSDSGIELTGTVKSDEFLSYAKKRNSPQTGTKNVERFKEQFGYLTLSLDHENLMVQGYSMGPSSTNQRLKVSFSNIELNPDLNENTFDYTAPNGVEIRDITKTILNRRNAN